MALLIVNAVSFKELHHLLEHQHDEMEHCEALGFEKHIHSEEYAHVDCFICFFHFSTSEIFQHELVFGKNQPVQIEIGFKYLDPIISPTYQQKSTRGPPFSFA